MAKYSTELKIEVVKAYLNDEGGFEYLANRYGISDESIVTLETNRSNREMV